MIFLLQWSVEVERSRWVVYGSDTDSMLQFQLEMGGDGTKRCWMMKQRQRARLGSMGRKCDMTRWYDDVGQRRCSIGEGEREEMTLIGLTQILLGQKIKKIHVVNSASTNRR
jgi:hypothetical protein